MTSFNNLTGRGDSAPHLLHYMISRRKKKKWEKLGRDTAGGAHRPQVSLTEEELRHLDAIHEELQVASDAYALNADAAKRLQDEFARRTGRVLPPMILAAATIRRRKDGALATLKPRSGDDLGFSDIDQVAK